MATSSVGPNDATSVTRVLAGRYRLSKLLGHGGMGSVYEAVHIHTEKKVAVKLLSTSLSKDLKLVARFRREAKAASRLEHENCVHVDDFDEDADGTFFIAMELIDGLGLADELRKSGPMPADRVARIGAQLLKALDAAHAAGVLHRDLKPQNVMLTHKPNRPDIVKVVDFGIAKITTNSSEDQGALTVPGTIFGTPEYMSPEQARGEALDARSDLYSAAVVLWHMLLGRSPFRGTSVRETLMKVFADEAPSAAQERPNQKIPPGFEDVLRKAMAKRKEDRYADAASFLEALAPFVTGGVEVPRRPQPGLAVDGAPPPSTIDDNAGRSVTQALPDAELAPLSGAAVSAEGLRGSAVLSKTQAAEATRFGALPTLALPEQPGPAPKVLTADKVKEQHPAAPPPLLTEHQASAPGPAAHGRSGGLSPAAIVVLACAALGVVGILVAAYVALTAPPAQPDNDGKNVVELKERDKQTTKEQQEKHQEVVDQLGDAPPDPVARDKALARAKTAMGNLDPLGALAAFDEAINADPTSAEAHYGRATIAMQQQDWRTARDHIERAMALDPKYARLLQGQYALAKKRAAEQP